MDEVLFITQMVMSMMENGEMTKLMEKVFTPMLMERHIMAIGLMTNKTGLVLKLGLMALSRKGSIRKERNMGKAN